jgi:hypothetical protein
MKRVLIVAALLAVATVAFAQEQRETRVDLMFIAWERFSVQQNEIVKRCVLLNADGHFRLERGGEAIGGGGSYKAYEGEVPAADLESIKALLDSQDFRSIALPKAKKTNGPRNIANEMESIQFVGGGAGRPMHLYLQSFDNDVPIPKPLKQLLDWVKKIEKIKAPVSKTPMKYCNKTERELMPVEEGHRIEKPE